MTEAWKRKPWHGCPLWGYPLAIPEALKPLPPEADNSRRVLRLVTGCSRQLCLKQMASPLFKIFLPMVLNPTQNLSHVWCHDCPSFVLTKRTAVQAAGHAVDQWKRSLPTRHGLWCIDTVNCSTNASCTGCRGHITSCSRRENYGRLMLNLCHLSRT